MNSTGLLLMSVLYQQKKKIGYQHYLLWGVTTFCRKLLLVIFIRHTLFSLSLDSFLCIWKEFPFLACYPGSGDSVSLWCYISVDICMVCVICKLCKVEINCLQQNSLLPSPAYSSHVPISSPGGQFFWHTALLHRSILNACAFNTKYTYSFA